MQEIQHSTLDLTIFVKAGYHCFYECFCLFSFSNYTSALYTQENYNGNKMEEKFQNIFLITYLFLRDKKKQISEL